ncbi:MAG: hypothetical protein ACK6D0_21205, partial [Planctomyces sp.]
MRELTEEELANAIRLDPGQFPGLGPSLDSLLRMLRERREKILATWETQTVRKKTVKRMAEAARQARPPGQFSKSFWNAIRSEQLYQLENLWYRAERVDPDFAARLPALMETMGEKYQVDMLASKYEFTGTQALTVEQAIEVYQELQQIDELLKQLEEAKKNARLAVIDLEELSEFADPETVQKLSAFQEQIQQHLKNLMEQQGLSGGNGRVQLSPKAYKLFQGRLLERIFSDLQASRSGRHQGPVEGDGVVELQRTRPWEFGDATAQIDLPGSLINAMLRQGADRPLRLH